MSSRALANAARIIVVASIYIIAGKLALRAAVVHPSASAVWPPTGISLAAFLLFGYRIWPAILVGAFVVNVTTAGSVATSIGIAVGNTLEGLCGAWLVNRFANGRDAFGRAPDIFKFAGLAAILATTVSATIGVTTLSLAGYAAWADFGSIWLTWWLGDAAGAIVVTPLLVLWYQDRALRWSAPRLCEAGLVLLALVVVGGVVFGGLSPFGSVNYPLAFLILPIVVWAAFRFGQREAATIIAVLSVIIIWGTLLGFGPFAVAPTNVSLLILQAFVGTIAMTTIPLAAVVAEGRRAREEAEAANVAKDEFLAVLSHELRTPLNAVLGWATLLRSGSVPEADWPRALEKVERNTRIQIRLVEDLLDVSGIRSGKLRLESRPVDLPSIIRAALDGVRPDAEAKEVRLEAEVETDVGRVAGDPLRLEQIIGNLLSNAVKFNPRGGQVTVRLERAGSRARVKIIDSGKGIAPEILPHIFEPFRQADSTTTRAYGGLGLGLTIVRHLVELHGGSIHAESAGVGKGATFTVLLPLAP